jgi:uncharacterized protein YozE (UPF0346 family)
MKLEEYETILADHGHKDVYYPKMIIKKKFKEYQICVFETGDFEFCMCMMDEIVSRYSVEDWDRNAVDILNALIVDGTVERCMPSLADSGPVDAGIID